MAANRYKSCPPPPPSPPSLTRSSNLFPRYGKRDIFHGFGEGRKKLCAATGTYMDGSFSGKSTMHVVLMTWMEAVKFVRIRWFFFFFFPLSPRFFFPPSLPLFSLRRCCVAFLMIVLSKVEMVVGLNGKWGFEWVIWRYRVLVFEWNMKKICRNGFFFFFFFRFRVLCDIFFFFYLFMDLVYWNE